MATKLVWNLFDWPWQQILLALFALTSKLCCGNMEALWLVVNVLDLYAMTWMLCYGNETSVVKKKLLYVP